MSLVLQQLIHICMQITGMCSAERQQLAWESAAHAVVQTIDIYVQTDIHAQCTLKMRYYSTK